MNIKYDIYIVNELNKKAKKENGLWLLRARFIWLRAHARCEANILADEQQQHIHESMLQ